MVKRFVMLAAVALAMTACTAGGAPPSSAPPPPSAEVPITTGGAMDVVKDVAGAVEVPAVIAAEAVLSGQFDQERANVLNGKVPAAELGKLRVKAQIAYGAAVTARVAYDFTAGLNNSPVSSVLIDEIRRSTDAAFAALLDAIDERTAT